MLWFPSPTGAASVEEAPVDGLEVRRLPKEVQRDVRRLNLRAPRVRSTQSASTAVPSPWQPTRLLCIQFFDAAGS